MMAWFLFPLVLTLVIFAGIRILSGKWPTANPAEDAEAIARWEVAQRRGFWRFAIGPMLVMLGSFLGGAVVRAWRITGSPIPPTQEILWFLGLAVIAGLGMAWGNWSRLDSAAAETRKRLDGGG